MKPHTNNGTLSIGGLILSSQTRANASHLRIEGERDGGLVQSDPLSPADMRRIIGWFAGEMLNAERLQLRNESQAAKAKGIG